MSEPKTLEERAKMIENLENERVNTAIAVQYNEKGRNPNENYFVALGFICEGWKSGPLCIDNGRSGLPYSMHSKQHHMIEIPKDQIIDYFVIKKTEE